jgi:hypothetical protein
MREGTRPHCPRCEMPAGELPRRCPVLRIDENHQVCSADGLRQFGGELVARLDLGLVLRKHRSKAVRHIPSQPVITAQPIAVTDN